MQCLSDRFLIFFWNVFVYKGVMTADMDTTIVDNAAYTNMVAYLAITLPDHLHSAGVTPPSQFDMSTLPTSQQLMNSRLLNF